MITAYPAMVFAAGRGTRMGTLTQDLPKPMIRVAGRPLIDHALTPLIEAGVRRIVVNTHYLPDPLEAHLAQERRVQITLSRETELLDTGGGLRHALPLLGHSPVWTINSDIAWAGPNPLQILDTPPPQGGAELLLVAKDRAIGDPGPGDFFRGKDGHLKRRGDAAEAPFVYTGLQLIDTATLVHFSQTVFSLNAVWDLMLSQGVLRGKVYPGQWCNVGQPQSLPLADAMVGNV